MVPGPATTQAGAMTSADTPPQGEPQPGATATDEGPRVTRDQVSDLARLRRSRTDRHIAGVAGGVARHLDIDPVIVRVVFVVTAFFGGAGLFAYGALWLLLPQEGETSAPISLDEKARGIALVVVGVVAALALLSDGWGGASWFPWQLVVIGVLLLLVLNRRNDRQERNEQRYGTSQTGWVGDAPTTYPPSTPGAPTYAAPTYTAPTSTAPGYDPPADVDPQDVYARDWARTQAGRPTYTPPAPPYGSTYVPPPPRPRDPRKRGPILFGFTLALIALALGTLGIVEASGADVTESAYPALALGITAAMLVVGAFWGRAGGLILLGVLLTIGLTATTTVSRVDGRTIEHVPGSAAAVQDRYWNAAGDMTVDLTRIEDVEALDGRTITVEGGVGAIDVVLPAGVDVVASGDIDGPGSVQVFGEESGGIDIYVSGSRSAGDDRPSITIDANLGVGEIVIS